MGPLSKKWTHIDTLKYGLKKNLCPQGFFLAHIWPFWTHIKNMGLVHFTHIKIWVKKYGMYFEN